MGSFFTGSAPVRSSSSSRSGGSRSRGASVGRRLWAGPLKSIFDAAGTTPSALFGSPAKYDDGADFSGLGVWVLENLAIDAALAGDVVDRFNGAKSVDPDRLKAAFDLPIAPGEVVKRLLSWRSAYRSAPVVAGAAAATAATPAARPVEGPATDLDALVEAKRIELATSYARKRITLSAMAEAEEALDLHLAEIGDIDQQVKTLLLAREAAIAALQAYTPASTAASAAAK